MTKETYRQRQIEETAMLELKKISRENHRYVKEFIEKYGITVKPFDNGYIIRGLDYFSCLTKDVKEMLHTLFLFDACRSLSKWN